MTPNDHMSHDLSYFSGPRTSGAVKKNETRHFSNEITTMLHIFTKVQVMQTLTSIVGCVAGSIQRVVRGGLLGKAKVCEFEKRIGPL